MELIKLNDKLSILINQDNCIAAKARFTSQTAVTPETFWPNGTQCCAESLYIKILKMSAYLSGALAFRSTCTVCPLISVKTKLLLLWILWVSSLLNGLVSLCWHVQSSRHFTWCMLMSILSKTPSEKFICLHSFSWIRNCIKLMQIKSYIARHFVLVN